MLNKIVLAGGSGYLGGVLADYYKNRAEKIIILSRGRHPSRENIYYEVWDGKTEGGWESQLEDCDLLINLSGKNVNCRYTKKNREEIFSSRLESTTILGNVIAKLRNPPKTWINLASATIYRHAEDHPQNEDDGDIGAGFSVEVCKAWEKTFMEIPLPKTKKIILRTGIVLGKKDEVIPKLINLVRFGLGGKIGSGEQYVSWIHEHDFARITEWVFYKAGPGDVFNCTAPGALKNRDLMRIIRKTYGFEFGLPSPQWLLEIGASVIGTETELVLKSRWVYPKKLLESGFHFHFPEAGPAIREILSTRL
jgi:uncharacterized protein